jgi:hypothetical protein
MRSTGKKRGSLTTLALLTLCLVSLVPFVVASQDSLGLSGALGVQNAKEDTSSEAGAQVNPKNLQAVVSNEPKPLLAPPVEDSRPFLRLVTILLLGLGITA